MAESLKKLKELFDLKDSDLRTYSPLTLAYMMETLEPLLTEEEKSVYRRGRNAHSATMAKHATMADYRRATGFEALMGYLYLKEDFSRILELVHAGLEKEEI